MRPSFGFLSLVALAASAQDTSITRVKQAFNAANIPADLSIKFDPTALLEVTFPQANARPITIHAGQQLPRNSTAGPPSFNLINTRARGRFVVAVVDPDAPTPQDPTSAQIRHFLGGNFVKGNGGLLSNSTPAISNFLQPTPPAGSDAHRYIFLVFNQPNGFNGQTEVTPATPISLFNISAFAQDVGLGNPIAGTFMLVAPDPTA
ncbi:OV-16 antigen [Leucoagaricus sp. SymC.cos]|nr:OV-16 antigen [Leucoagaricus sp. SymC.cos]